MMYPKSVSARKSAKKKTERKADVPGVCCRCGRNGCTDPLDKHHIFCGALRKKSFVREIGPLSQNWMP